MVFFVQNNMDEDMETRMRTWKHGWGLGNMEEDMEIWTRTWRHR
jgi:predicted glutamine amidotransferase